jgi:hypothetical protein
MVFLIPYVYTYGTERTPITLISACVPFLKRNTKGTERNTEHLIYPTTNWVTMASVNEKCSLPKAVK